MAPLLTIIVPSRRPSQLQGMLDNLEEVTTDYSRIELVVKVDDDVGDAVEILEREQKRRPYVIRFVCTPRHGGVFTLWAGQHEAFEASNPETYFYVFASDELRILTKGWDDILAKYVGWFPDHVFRLRLSACKYRNYHRLFDCTFMPDSFALITRRWMELAEGTGHCWGTDAFHQCVAYHLSNGSGDRLNIWHADGYWRDVQVHDIELGGMEFGKDITAREFIARNLRISQEWLRLTSFPAQERFSYLARRIQLYCDMYRDGYTEKFVIEDRPIEKILAARMVDSGLIMKFADYRLPAATILMENLLIRTRMLKNVARNLVAFSILTMVTPQESFSGAQSDLPSLRQRYPVLNTISNILDILQLRWPTPFKGADDAPEDIKPTRNNRLGTFLGINRADVRNAIGRTVRAGRTIITAPFMAVFRVTYVNAPGLEPQWLPIQALKNTLFRRLGYPVADKEALGDAYRSLRAAELKMSKLTFEFPERQKEEQLADEPLPPSPPAV